MSDDDPHLGGRSLVENLNAQIGGKLRRNPFKFCLYRAAKLDIFLLTRIMESLQIHWRTDFRSFFSMEFGDGEDFFRFFFSVEKCSVALRKTMIMDSIIRSAKIQYFNSCWKVFFLDGYYDGAMCVCLVILLKERSIQD